VWQKGGWVRDWRERRRLLAMRAMRACRCVAPLGRGRFQSFFFDKSSGTVRFKKH
jgi:hypothetical protein